MILAGLFIMMPELSPSATYAALDLISGFHSLELKRNMVMSVWPGSTGYGVNNIKSLTGNNDDEDDDALDDELSVR